MLATVIMLVSNEQAEKEKIQCSICKPCIDMTITSSVFNFLFVYINL